MCRILCIRYLCAATSQPMLRHPGQKQVSARVRNRQLFRPSRPPDRSAPRHRHHSPRRPRATIVTATCFACHQTSICKTPWRFLAYIARQHCCLQSRTDAQLKCETFSSLFDQLRLALLDEVRVTDTQSPHRNDIRSHLASGHTPEYTPTYPACPVPHLTSRHLTSPHLT